MSQRNQFSLQFCYNLFTIPDVRMLMLNVMTHAQSRTTTHTYWLLFWLALALVLRLAYALSQDPADPYVVRGGDSSWYLITSWMLLNGADLQLTPPPLYLLLLGILQQLFSPAGAVIALRILQSLMGVATCYFAYRLAGRIGGERAGMMALVVSAIFPVFILEVVHIATETLFIFLLAAGLTLYVEGRDDPQPLRRYALIGVLLGLATLTRAVLLLFPVGLLVHLLLTQRPAKALRWGAALLVCYALVVSTWTFYNLARWDRFIIAGEGFASLFYAGASGWEGPYQTDENLAEDTTLGEDASQQERYVDGAQNVIGQDVQGYLQRRLGELAGAYLQPHGVTYFPGESLRELALHWLNEDRSVDGFLRLLQGDFFIPKFLIYLLHYGVILLGLSGIWLSRSQWRSTLPLAGFIAYITLIHLALLALPRYIYPTLPFWIVFATVAVARFWLPTRKAAVASGASEGMKP
jgi:4-amino-4-deoxy-L-arabinose transferase-like glycosyltransferase